MQIRGDTFQILDPFIDRIVAEFFALCRGNQGILGDNQFRNQIHHRIQLFNIYTDGAGNDRFSRRFLDRRCIAICGR